MKIEIFDEKTAKEAEDHLRLKLVYDENINTVALVCVSENGTPLRKGTIAEIDENGMHVFYSQVLPDSMRDEDDDLNVTFG